MSIEFNVKTGKTTEIEEIAEIVENPVETPIETKEDLKQQITEIREKADRIEDKINNLEGEI